MIIQINATVCADVDHGDNVRRKIAGSDQERRTQGEKGRASNQEKREIK